MDTADINLYAGCGLFDGNAATTPLSHVEGWLEDSGFAPESVSGDVKAVIAAVGLPADVGTADLLASLAATA